MRDAGAVEMPREGALGAREIRSHVLRYAPSVAVPAVMATIFTAVFTRVFDASAYGYYTLVLSTSYAAASVLCSWLQQAITRFVPGVTDGDNLDHLKGGYLIGLLGMTAFVAIVGLAVLPLASGLLEPGLASMMWSAFVLILVNVVYSGLSTLLQAELRSGRYSVYTVSNSVLRLLLAVVLTLVVSYTHPAALVWANAAAMVLVLPPLIKDVRFPSPSSMLRHRHDVTKRVKDFAVYGVPMMGWIAASALLDTSDRYIIQIFRGSGEVGIYAANYSVIYGAASLINAPLLFAVHTLLMKAHNEGDTKTAGRWLERITEWYFVCGSILVGACFLLSKDIARFLLGPSFHSGHIIIPVVLAGLVVWHWSIYAHKPLEFAGKTRLLLGIAVVAAVLNIVLNVLLVPRFGYAAAAYTTLAAYATYGVFAYRLGNRFMAWRIPWKRPLGGLGICAAFIVVSHQARTVVEAYAGYAPGLALTCTGILLMVAAVALRYRMLAIPASSKL